MKNNNKQKIIIIRGPSGSGKTTLANKIIKYYKNIGIDMILCEADQFRLDEFGHYHFDPLTKEECHNKCFEKFKNAIDNNISVIVANCFIKKEHVAKYIDYIKSKNLEYMVIRTEQIYQNLHEVTADSVKRMIDTYEPLEEDVLLKNSPFNSL